MTFDGTMEVAHCMLVGMGLASPECRWEEIERRCWRLKLKEGQGTVRYRFGRRSASMTIQGAAANALRQRFTRWNKEHGTMPVFPECRESSHSMREDEGHEAAIVSCTTEGGKS
jgi:hypothetical protein